jgi:hypothetical protein
MPRAHSREGGHRAFLTSPSLPLSHAVLFVYPEVTR